jgi:hypothetical protein
LTVGVLPFIEEVEIVHNISVQSSLES